MPETTNRPLWEVMRQAGEQARINWTRLDATKYAAELRAIAKWLIDNDAEFQMGGDAAETARLLLAEADRAEAGQ